MNIEKYKTGSKIHIKKKNRGKFTNYCGGNVTNECIRKAKASGNPTLVKRATFAANARKWKHQYGGVMLPEVLITPTNDMNWLFQKGKYKRNIRPFIDTEPKKYVLDYLSRFDNEDALEYNARIKRLADALEMRSMGIKKIEDGNKRAYMTSEDEVMHVGNMNDIFAELAHPWQYVFGNNQRENEAGKDYNPDKDPRGGTRYAYPDTFEGETHAFFEPTFREYIETGKIGKSSPFVNKKLSQSKIVPKDIKEVADSAASWDKQAINNRKIVNYSQLPLVKSIQYSLFDFPLLNKTKKHQKGGSIYSKYYENSI